ncbi:hypothetical protein [Hymenobacter sp. BT559]|uniref:hypothetical protein n=1 Tax=Hymenobacter sp. BT559 TaxID=2795729 RepID=UPI0018EC8712|nr:hypothetical protein [Hymenobacter sp. BT559]MBJ6141755.1 hypothetical protein [Hymenobacter sp. BT559]
MEKIDVLYDEYKVNRIVGARDPMANLLEKSQKLPTPIFKGLVFHLPFALLAPTGFILNESEDILQTQIQIIGHPNHLFNVRVEAEEYKEKLLEEAVIVSLLFANGKPYADNPFTVNGTAIFPGDRLGKLTHTIVAAQIPIDKVRDDFKWDTGLFCDLAVDAVNRFVAHYKVKSGWPSDWLAFIPSLTSPMVMEFKVLTTLVDNRTFIERYLDMSGLVMSTIPENIAVDLKAVLLTNEEPDLIATYYLQIDNRISIKDWRSVAIDSAVLFESWLTTKLKSIYKSQGLSGKQIKLKFSIGEERRPMAALDIVTLLLPEILGFEFKDTEQCKELLKNVFTLRNHVVHGRRFKVTKFEAELSYSTVKQAIGYIDLHMNR